MNKDYNNKGIFISNTNKFFDDKLFLQALRYDKYSDFENKTTGKIGIKQYIIDDLNISSNYGKDIMSQHLKIYQLQQIMF